MTEPKDDKPKRPRGRPRKIVPASEAVQAETKPADEPAPKRKNKPGAGRPRIAIDLEWVAAMAEIGCTAEEIAACYRQDGGRIGVSVDTIVRRFKEDHGINYADFIAQKKLVGHEKIRRKMHDRAMEGSDAMVIWLSKNRLGYSDKKEIAHDNAASGKLIVNLTTDKPG